MKQNTYVACALIASALFTACTESSEGLDSCDTVTTTYQIGQAKPPRNHFQAVLAARDFNGDHNTDNVLGVASVAMVQLASEFDPEPNMAAHLRAAPWLVQITECRAATGAATSQRVKADVTLQHNGVVEIATAERRGSQYVIAADQATLPLTWLADSTSSANAMPPGWIASHRAELVINVQGEQFSGRFTALVEPTQARSMMIDPLVEFFNAPERSRLLRFALDTDGNGTISRDELRNQGAFTELTAPDILDEVSGMKSWTSIGFEIAGQQIARD